MKRRGFTLIELLVVIAIIGFIASIVLVNLQGVRGRGRMAAGKQFSSSLQHTLGAYAVGIWRFEDGSGTTALDSSGYINNGTLNGGPTWRTEAECGLELGGCLEFDGVDDVTQVVASSSLDTLTDMLTISVWVYPTLLDGTWRRIITRDSFPNQRWYIENAGSNPGKIAFFGGGSGSSSSSDTILDTGNWYHIAMTNDGSKTRLYVNGVLDKEIPSSGTIGIVGDIFIGADNLAGSTSWLGKIDDVYIFSTSLTTAQIQKLYAEGLKKRTIAQN